MGRRLLLSAVVLLLLFISSLSEVHYASFKIVNNCRHTIWPALLDARTQLPTTGFALKSGESKNLSIPNSFQGRIWARTHCGQDSGGKFTCLTGDCGTGELECNGGVPQAPITMAEFALNTLSGIDFYDVSVVDGFNLPMLVAAKGKTGACATSGCLVDLNSACPKLLSVASGNGDEGEVVACQNVCAVIDRNEAVNCGRSLYAQFFQSTCPRAYVQPYEDRIATLECVSANYTITFCPLPNTGKSTTK